MAQELDGTADFAGKTSDVRSGSPKFCVEHSESKFFHMGSPICFEQALTRRRAGRANHLDLRQGGEAAYARSGGTLLRGRH